MADGHGWNAAAVFQRIGQAKLSKDFAALKKVLAEVAESNYHACHRWNIPRTVPVSYADCQAFPVRGSVSTPVISFSAENTVDAMLLFAQDKRQVVCGLNFANGKDVGGGYKNGSTAQEEDLCRRIPPLYTSLFRASKDGLYPFGPSTCKSAANPEKYSDVLFTTDLTIAREGEEEGFAFFPAAKEVKVSMVAAAAPNVRFANEVSDVGLMYRTIQAIFIAPKIVQPEITTLVLGAWGCGAFGGNPVEIAGLFAQALVRDNLGQLYREVHFAIPRTSPTDANHDTFLEVFKKHHIKVKGH